MEADAFIEQVKSENASLRAELEKKINAEDQLAQLRAELTKSKQNADEPKGNNNPSLTTEAIEDIVTKSITRIETQRTATQNVKTVEGTMVSHFGNVDKAKAAFAEKANQLGMSTEELTAIAAKSPTAFFKLVDLGVSNQPNQTRLTKSDVNLATLEDTKTKEGSKEYFDNIRKTNAKLYWSPKTQQEIFKSKKAGTYD
jgi:hypothetical protein